MATTPDEMELLRAIKQENWKAVEELVAQGTNVNIIHHGSNTLLMWAASTGNTTLIGILSKAKNLDLEERDNNDNTALQHAINKKQWEAAIVLIELGANVDTYDQYGNIPLLNVVYNKQWKVAEALLKAGAKANILYDRDITLLMQAASTGNTTLIDMFSKAQDLKEALTARDKNFNTALMLAITNKQWGAAKALIDLGTNVNTRDRWNNTPLMLAAAYGNADIIQHIFSKIADPKSALETQNVNGDTALMLAITNKQWGSVEALIALGAKMDTQNKYGYTSMMLLLRHANLPIVQQIISSFNFSIDVMKNAQERDKLIGIIKEAGHILGFKTPVSGIAPEGLFITDEHPGCLILKKYLDKLPDTATRSKITEALDLANNFYQKNGVTDNNSNYKELMDYHQGRNCTILPIHWSSPEGDHAITLIAWNDILVICNRGDKKLKEGISVFRIPTASDDSTITQKFLETIMPKDGYVSAETVLREIRSCVGKTEIENPILTFSSLEQQHGNCGFVNLKSSLYPILSFIALLKDNKIGPENFNYTFLSPYLPQSQDPKKQQELQNIKERSKTAYKKFTKEMRDTTVKELCNEFQKLPFGSEKRGIYLEMFAAILYEHYGQEKNSLGRARSPEKIKAEQERARQILSAMTQTEQQKTLAALTELHNQKIRTAKESMDQKESKESQAALAELDKANAANAVTQLLQQLEEGYKVVIKQLEHEIAQSAPTVLPPKAADSININAVLLLAAKKNLSNVVQFLAQQPGIDLNTKNNQGDTVLSVTADRGRWNVARFLMQQPGVDLNSKDDATNTTVLHTAAAEGQLDIVQFLTQRSEVDLNAKDSPGGNTAVLLAAKYEQWDCVTYLLQRPRIELEPHTKEDILRKAQAANQTEIINLLQPTKEMKPFLPMLTIHLSDTPDVAKKNEDGKKNKPGD